MQEGDVVTFDSLSPPYSTIVADPPWRYEQATASHWPKLAHTGPGNPMPYSMMSIEDISAMPVSDLAASDSHLYLWTTNRYLRASYGIAEAWGFKFSQILTWCKPTHGVASGGAYSPTTEFMLFARRGSLKPLSRTDSTWWEWPRGAHSVKPGGALDVIETVSPGPYVELFARQPRLGWDAWGHGYEGQAAS